MASGNYSVNTTDFDIYLDESGDLGWNFESPYRNQGSSRYFTIAYVIIPTLQTKHIVRFVNKFKKKRGAIREIKGSEIRTGYAKTLARDIVRLTDRLPEVVMGAVTAKKEGAPDILKINSHGDILYNHMVKKAVCAHLTDCDTVNIIPDKRSVPKGSQNSCLDLIRENIWINQAQEVNIKYTPEESHLNEQLVFIDWVANFTWRHYENGQSSPFQILSPHLKEDLLFFS